MKYNIKQYNIYVTGLSKKDERIKGANKQLQEITSM